jgi:hypothetical protein
MNYKKNENIKKKQLIDTSNDQQCGAQIDIIIICKLYFLPLPNYSFAHIILFFCTHYYISDNMAQNEKAMKKMKIGFHICP